MNSYDDYKVGYGKPPREYQFKKGQCANPKGRGCNKGPGPGEQFVQVHAERIDTGATRWQSTINGLIAGAAAGQLNAMESLIDMYFDSKKGGDFKGDGTKRVTNKSSRVLKVMELEEKYNRSHPRPQHVRACW